MNGTDLAGLIDWRFGEEARLFCGCDTGGKAISFKSRYQMIELHDNHQFSVSQGACPGCGSHTNSLLAVD